MYELPPETFITIGKQIIKNVALPMSIIMPASIVGLLILCIMSWKTKSIYFYCIFTTLLLFTIALIITVAVEVPMDNQIKTWSAATIPFNWQYIRNRWEHYHTIRTLVSLTGMVFFLVAIMNDKQTRVLKF
jgi:uncharacterized membrane protein